jgi:hypothetical protein
MTNLFIQVSIVLELQGNLSPQPHPDLGNNEEYRIW